MAPIDPTNSFSIQGYDKLSQSVKILVSIALIGTVKTIFQGSSRKASKGSLSLAHGTVEFFFVQLCKFFQTLQHFWSPFRLKLLLVDFFVLMLEKHSTVSLKSFNFFPFASTVLSTKLLGTGNSFTPLEYFESLPNFATRMHQMSFLSLAKAFILRNLHKARVNFVPRTFRRKKCFTFDTDRLLGFSSLRTDASAETQHPAFTILAATHVFFLKGA